MGTLATVTLRTRGATRRCRRREQKRTEHQGQWYAGHHAAVPEKAARGAGRRSAELLSSAVGTGRMRRRVLEDRDHRLAQTPRSTGCDVRCAREKVRKPQSPRRVRRTAARRPLTLLLARTPGGISPKRRPSRCSDARSPHAQRTVRRAPPPRPAACAFAHAPPPPWVVCCRRNALSVMASSSSSHSSGASPSTVSDSQLGLRARTRLRRAAATRYM